MQQLQAQTTVNPDLVERITDPDWWDHAGKPEMVAILHQVVGRIVVDFKGKVVVGVEWRIYSAGTSLLRVRTAREFKLWEGGGYDVLIGLIQPFGQRTSVMTAFPNNDVGRFGFVIADEKPPSLTACRVQVKRYKRFL